MSFPHFAGQVNSAMHVNYVTFTVYSYTVYRIVHYISSIIGIIFISKGQKYKNEHDYKHIKAYCRDIIENQNNSLVCLTHQVCLAIC